MLGQVKLLPDLTSPDLTWPDLFQWYPQCCMNWNPYKIGKNVIYNNYERQGWTSHQKYLLLLPNSSLYTRHSFIRSLAVLSANAGENLTNLQRYGDCWSMAIKKYKKYSCHDKINSEGSCNCESSSHPNTLSLSNLVVTLRNNFHAQFLKWTRILYPICHQR